MSNCPDRHRADRKYTAKQLRQMCWGAGLFIVGAVLMVIGLIMERVQ
jgi:hypothetical protein